MLKNRFSIALLLVVALLLVSCSDLATIEITYDGLAILEPGQEVNLAAVGKTSLNMNADLDELVWELSDNSLGTLESTDEGVLFKALKAGTVTITVSSGEISESITFEVVDNIPNPVVFFESFEDGVAGEYPTGWEIKDKSVHDTQGHSGGRISTEMATDGSKSAKVVSVPDGEGRITFDFPEPLLYNSLTVDFYLPEGQDNINLELYGETGRVFGLFITTTGNIRYRHPDGGNGSNVSNAPNNKWHTAEFHWNDAEKIYHAFVTTDGNKVRITPDGGSPYETDAYDDAVTKFSAMITKRDGDKVFYIDNIEVLDLAIVERLAQ